jgi:Protein of unknown function (DUF3972)
MEQLIKPSEYAHSQNISRQAVYAKIKRGILETKSVEGKLYIVVGATPNGQSDEPQTREYPHDTIHRTPPSNPLIDYTLLLQSKDETISVLKGTVKDLKKSNKQMSTTLRGEIDLLKQAFHEMRSLYITQIDHIKQRPKYTENETLYGDDGDETIEVSIAKASTPTYYETQVSEHEPIENSKWIGYKKYLKKNAIFDDMQKTAFKHRINEAYTLGDSRLKVIDGRIRLDGEANFDDLLR